MDSNGGQVGGDGRTDHQPKVFCPIPSGRGQVRNLLIDLSAIGQWKVLEVCSSGIAGPTKQKHPFVRIGQKWSDAVLAHVGAECDGVCTVALKGLSDIVLRCASNVSSFCVEDDEFPGILGSHIATELEQHGLRRLGCEVSDLRLECACERGRRINDALAELQHAFLFWCGLKGKRQASRLGIQAHTQQGA